MITADTLRVRDPFIVPVPDANAYDLFLNSRVAGREDPGETVCVLRSTDLYHFEEPKPILRFASNYEATQCWAPEVHAYQGKWFLLTTNSYTRPGCGVLTGSLPPEEVRGTYAYVSDHLEGPYTPWSEGPLTPWPSLCLDGSLYVDPHGEPWLVYCHEWLQTHNGVVEAVPLSRDLRSRAGEPARLFTGSTAPWSWGEFTETYDGIPIHDHSFVTDGPFLFNDHSGALCTLWSTLDQGVYKTGIARSLSGTVTGPWTQQPEALFTDDGGHGMLFHALDGRLILAIHQTNQAMRERLAMFRVEITDTGLHIAERLTHL